MKIGISNTRRKTLAVTMLAMTAVLGASLATAGETRRATTPAGLGVWKPSTMIAKPGAGTTSGRIVGGTLAQGDRSFAVHTQGQYWCGGTIIGDSWVLTAAHCGRPNIVKAGSTNHTQATSYDVIEYYAHPNYREATGDDPYDIALIKVRGTFPTSLIRAKLADATVMQAVARPGDPVTVLGWGATSQGGSGSTSLREVTIPVVSDATCGAVYNGTVSPLDLTPAVEICAGLPEGGKDSCQGDSGGPLIVPYNGSIYSVGVVSWGEGCAQPNRYGVYAETAAFLAWINSYTGGGTGTGTVVHNVNLPSVSTGNWSSIYTVAIPAGTTKLVVNTSGGTGDADLYVRAGAAPTTTSYTCRPYLSGNTETCTINNPVAGTTYYIGVRAYSSYSGVNMKATRTP